MPPERTWSRALRDAAPVAFVLALCPVVAAMAGGPAAPLARTGRLIGWERSMGLLFEPAVHGWVAARPALMSLADFGYAAIHLPVMLGVLIWVWFARPGAFRLARNGFVAAQALCVVGYVLVPTAPPRMVASLGYHAGGAGLSGIDRLAMSPYAAVPSGHAAFALIASGIVICLSRRRLVQLAAALYPAAILLEIVATGNHLWLDAVAGAAAAALGFGLAYAIEHGARSRRPAWRAEPVSDGSPG